MSIFLDCFNSPIGTILYRGRGQDNVREWRIAQKYTLSFNEKRIILKGGPFCKPIFITWDEFEDDPFFDTMRLKY